MSDRSAGKSISLPGGLLVIKGPKTYEGEARNTLLVNKVTVLPIWMVYHISTH